MIWGWFWMLEDQFSQIWDPRFEDRDEKSGVRSNLRSQIRSRRMILGRDRDLEIDFGREISDLRFEIRSGSWNQARDVNLRFGIWFGGSKIESWGWFRLRIEIWRSIFPDLNSQMKHFPRFEVLRSEIRGSRFKISQIWRSQDRDLRFRIGFGGRNRVWIGIWRWISGSDSISEVNFGSRTSSDRDREDDFGSWSSSDPDSEVDFGSRTSSDRDREVIFGLRISDSRSDSDSEIDFGARMSDLGSRMSDFGPQMSDFGFGIGSRSRISGSTSDFGPQILDFRVSSIQFRSWSRNRGPEIEGRGTSKLRFWSHFEPKMTHFGPSIWRPRVG